MAWCLQAKSHYLIQCWPKTVSPYGVTLPQLGEVYLLSSAVRFMYHVMPCYTFRSLRLYGFRPRIRLAQKYGAGHSAPILTLHESSYIWLKCSWSHLYVAIVICSWFSSVHDDVIKWKHFPRNWPFVREIHRSPVNYPYKGQWRGALMFSLIYAWINDWVNNREAGDLRRQHGHYDVIVMHKLFFVSISVSRLRSRCAICVLEWQPSSV